jgi:Uma2 family endonuclease
MPLLERTRISPTKELTSLRHLRPGTRYVPDRLLTVDEFFALTDEDVRAELDEGVIVIMPPVNLIHEQVFGFLYRLLGDFVEAMDLGIVLGSRASVRLSLRTAREPDIFFVSMMRLGILKEREIAGAPDLVIEIISSDTGRREAYTKQPQYEAAGVQELWFVDLPRRQVRICQLTEGVYEEAAQAEGETAVSRVVPGFRVAVSALLSPLGQFPRVDELLKELLAAQSA